MSQTPTPETSPTSPTPKGLTPLNVEMKLSAGAFRWRLELDLTQLSQRLIHDHLANGRLYEPDLATLMLRTLGPGSVFLEIGGHVGTFSMLAGHLIGAEGAVIAIEPNPDNIGHFRRHVTLNEHENVHLIEAACCDREGTMEFFTNLDNDGGHALWDVGEHSFNQKSKADPQRTEVKTVTVDGVLAAQDVARVDLIKVDTEGAELSVMQGAERTLRELRPPLIVCEFNRFGLEQMGTSMPELRAFMDDRGYGCYLMNAEGDLPRHVPDGIELVSRSVANVLFALPEALPRFWPQVGVG